MRTIKELISNEKKVYILLNSKAIQFRFMSDAEREGITYGDNVKPTERAVDDIMALRPDGTICFLGWAGRMCYHYNPNNILRIDYSRVASNNPCAVGRSFYALTRYARDRGLYPHMKNPGFTRPGFLFALSLQNRKEKDGNLRKP